MGGVRIGGTAQVPIPGLLPWSMFTASGAELYVMQAGSLLQLSPTSVFDVQANPIISPDGQSGAFRDFTDPDGYAAIYVVPMDGSAAAGPLDPTYQIWNDGSGDPAQTPSWHPDGNQVVFTSSAPEGMYVGGTTFGKIVVADYPAGSSTTLWVPDIQSPTQREEGCRPVFSPDGTKIAFFVNIAAGGGGDLSRQGLWVMDADGSNDQLIDALDTGSVGGGYGYSGTQAVWSNDSAWIAYTTQTQSGDVPDLYKIQPDGTGKTLLKASPDSSGVWIGWGAWKDDDSQILLSRYEPASGNARFSLFYINPDGTGETEIHNGSGVNDGPAFVQDQRQAWRLRDRIYWASDDDPVKIYSCALDGTDTQNYYDGTADGTIMAGGVEFD